MKCELNCKQDDANMIIKFSLFELPKSFKVLFAFVAKENPKRTKIWENIPSEENLSNACRFSEVQDEIDAVSTRPR